MKTWKKRVITLTVGFSMILSSVGTPLGTVIKLAPAKTAVAASTSTRTQAATLWNTETEATMTLPELNPKDGWTAVGWTTSTDPLADTSAAGASANVADDTTFYGVYKKSVTFNVNGSSTTQDVYANSANPDEQKTKVTAPAATTPPEGYHFIGWKEEGGDGTVYNPGDEMIVTGEGDIVPVYEANSYTVKYFDGEEKGSSTFVYGVKQGLKTASELGLTKAGHVFVGWSKTDGGSEDYNDGQRVSNLTTTQDGTVKLYAVWRKSKSGLTVNPVGGTCEIDGTSYSSQQIFSDKEYQDTLTIKNPSKTGYTFNSWDQSYDTTKADTFNGQISSVEGGITYTFGEKDGAADTLTADWTAHKYTFKFNGGEGAEGSMSDQEFTYDEPANLNRCAFQKTGYLFNGWKLPDGTTYGGSDTLSDGALISNLTATDGKTITLTAQWTPITYTLEYWSDGSSLDSESLTYGISHTLKTKEELNATKTGYTFLGWSKSPDAATADFNDGSTVENESTTQGETIKLYAVWKINGSTVKVNPNDGTWTHGGNTYTNEQTFTQNYRTTLTVETPSREGYTFKEWKQTGSNGSLAGDTYTFGPTAGEEDTLTAQWSAHHYKIHFNGNGKDSGEMEDQSFAYDDPLTALTSNSFKKTGYTFRGWAETWNGEVKYTNGQEVNNLTPVDGEVIQLYAVWEINHSGLTVVPNGGKWQHGDEEASEANKTFPGAFRDTVTIADPFREGYKFDGWKKSENFNGEFSDGVYTFGPKDKTEDTLTAQWTAHKYKIRFNGNGATSGEMTEQTINYDQSTNLNRCAFQKTGYTFKGWAPEQDGDVVYTNGKSVENLTTEDDKVIDLYAVWAVNHYTVEYYNGDVKKGETTFEYDKEAPLKSLALLGIENQGHTFLGWATSKNGAKKYNDAERINRLSEEDGKVIKLYTIWEVNKSGLTVIPAGGTWNHNSEDYLEPQTFKEPFGTEISIADPERIGYMFSGWDKSFDSEKANEFNGSLDEKKYTFGKKKDASDTLTAQWTANKYTVKYHNEEGDEVETSTFTYDRADTLKAASSLGLAKNGYVFRGWSTTPGGSLKFSDVEEVINLTSASGGIVNLYPVYDAITYTIHFSSQNSGGVMNDLVCSYNVERKLPANKFERIGYTFKGWSKSQDTATVDFNDEAVVKNLTDRSETINLYAVWEINESTLVLYPEGGVWKNGSEDYRDVTEFTKSFGETLSIANPTKEGHEFNGWSKSEDLNGTLEDGTYTFGPRSGTRDTLVATWLKNPYTVTYNGNNETSGSIDSQRVAYNQPFNLAKNSFKKTGYTFEGWSKTANGSVKYADQATVENLTDEKNGVVTLYAVWKPITYKVTYNGNGSVSGEMKEQDFTYDEEKQLLPCAFKRDGYTFVGWARNAKGSSEFIDKASVQNLTTQNETITLYAVWSKNRSTLTVIPNSGTWSHGGNNYSSSKSISEETGSTVSVANPEKLGYKFKGWTQGFNSEKAKSFNGTLEGEKYTFGNVNGAEDTLTAQWEPIKYTVQYLSDGKEVSTSEFTYDQGGSLKTCESLKLTKDGYTFMGWSDVKNGAVKYTDKATVKNLTVRSGEKIQLHAVWKENSYRVEYYNSGTKVGDSMHYCNQSANLKSVKALKLGKTGYTFAGWANAENGAVLYKDGQEVPSLTKKNNEVVKLYAVWIPNKYTVEYCDGEKTVGSSSFIYDKEGELTKAATLGIKKDGYHFLGWSDKTTGTVKYTDGQKVKNLSPGVDDTVKLYPVWESNKYTVDYCDGEKVVKSGSFVYDQETSLLSANTLGVAKTGYTFEGWSLTNGGEIKYTDKAKVKNLIVENNGSAKLYAVWTPNKYTIEYCDGESVAGKSEVTYDQEVELKTLADLELKKEGYVFQGWKSSTDTDALYEDGAKVKNLTTTKDGRVKLKASWKASDYKVQYYDGEKLLGESEFVYDQAGSLATLLELGKNFNGYDVEGWSTEKDGAVTYKQGQSVKSLTSSGVLKLYLVRKLHEYKITYSGLDGATTNPTSYTVEQKVTVKAVSKDGYTFLGWTGTGLDSVTKSFKIPAGSTGDRKYTANWKKNPIDKSSTKKPKNVKPNPTKKSDATKKPSTKKPATKKPATKKPSTKKPSATKQSSIPWGSNSWGSGSSSSSSWGGSSSGSSGSGSGSGSGSDKSESSNSSSSSGKNSSHSSDSDSSKRITAYNGYDYSQQSHLGDAYQNVDSSSISEETGISAYGALKGDSETKTSNDTMTGSGGSSTSSKVDTPDERTKLGFFAGILACVKWLWSPIGLIAIVSIAVISAALITYRKRKDGTNEKPNDDKEALK